MEKKRIMFLGASGQIGQAFRTEQKPQDWEVFYCDRTTCDITNTGALRAAVHNFKPELVINAAAMTNVDACEKEHDLARAVNFEAIGNLAAQCSAFDAPLIHLSTDYVFDGQDHTTPYTTDDPMNPLSAYGETKMLGEEAIRHEFPWHVILRTSSVFSEYGNNILTKVLSGFEEKGIINGITDQTSCPTYAPDITSALVKIADAILHGKSDGFGTFHLCGEDAATRYEFMQAILDAYAPYTTHRPTLNAIQRADVVGAAPRPAYSALDCAKIARVYGISQNAWRDGLQKAIGTYVKMKGEPA